MRRVYLIAVLAIMLQGIFVPRAYAWWDGVEHMSGPGPFFGWDVQLRLFCVVKPVGQDKSEIRTAGAAGAILNVCRALRGKDKDADNEKVRLMFDLGARFMRTKKYEDQLGRGDIPDFAHGKQIHFTTLEPAVMFPVVEKDWFRLDYGFGAGLYWISSEDFEPVRGTLIEPVRFDVRIQPRKWKGVAAVGRLGWLNFPAGFNFADFNGTAPDHNGRISSDWAKTLSFFVDITPIAEKWTKALAR
jgi:hypothetical protein